MPGLPLLIALLLDATASWKRYAVVMPAICGLLLLTQTADKLTEPYAFNGWRDEPVGLATETSSLPQCTASGCPWTPSPDRRGYRHHSHALGAGGRHLHLSVHAAVLLPVGTKQPATYSWSHNIDAVPDAVAESDAAILLRTRPAVIVYYDFPPGFRGMGRGAVARRTAERPARHRCGHSSDSRRNTSWPAASPSP